MLDPLVTIGMTTYNAADTIERALQSALEQDWRPIEILVVDDCSQDDTARRVEAVAAQNPLIRLIRLTQNGGVAQARNVIVREARGAFIAFFDDDDESMPHRVTAQVRRIEEYEKGLPDGALVLCHAARRQEFPDGFHRIETTMGTRAGKAPAGLSVARRILVGDPLPDGYGSVATCSQMARTSTYCAVGGFDPLFRRGEDTELCVRLALEDAHFVGIAEPLVTQKMNVTSEKGLEIEGALFLALLKKHRRAFKSDAEFRFSLAWVTLKYVWLQSRRRAFLNGLIKLALRHPLLVVRRGIYSLPMIASRKSQKQLHSHAV